LKALKRKDTRLVKIVIKDFQRQILFFLLKKLANRAAARASFFLMRKHMPLANNKTGHKTIPIFEEILEGS